MTDKYFKYLFAFLSFANTLIIYILTLAPTVGFIDTGELATDCLKLCIGHPTGYPLFTMIGHIFAFIPIGDGIYRLNLMSAVMGAVAVCEFYFLMIFLFTVYVFPKDFIKKFIDEQENKNFKNLSIYLIAFISSLCLAFSVTFWNICNGIEVYSLHILFLITVNFLFFKACDITVRNSVNKERYWLLFAFVLGLSFTNHLTTIFLAPSTLFLYFAVNGFNKLSFQRILIMAIPFAVALTLYIYLPVRADNPVLSWGYPDNLVNMYRHISAKQFNVWMFSSTEVMKKQLEHFIEFYPKEFFYFPLIIAVIGLFSIFRFNKKFFYFTIVLFIFNIFYASNYDIHDIESYYISVFIVNAVWIGFGIFYIINKIKFNKLTLSVLALLIPLVIVMKNYKECDESRNYYPYEFMQNIFKSARQNSIIISSQWDFWLASAWYFQYIHNVRPDIWVIDKELLRRSWYIRHIQIHYPRIYELSRTEFENFLPELYKFENETSRYLTPKTEFDKQELMKINNAYIALLNSLVDKNVPERSVYTTYEIEQSKTEKFGKDYLRVPEGLLMRYTKEKGFDSTYQEPDFKYEITKNPDYYYEFLMQSYYDSYLYRANYLMNFNKFDKAEELLKKCLELDNQRADAKMLLKKISELKANIK